MTSLVNFYLTRSVSAIALFIYYNLETTLVSISQWKQKDSNDQSNKLCSCFIIQPTIHKPNQVHQPTISSSKLVQVVRKHFRRKWKRRMGLFLWPFYSSVTNNALICHSSNLVIKMLLLSLSSSPFTIDKIGSKLFCSKIGELNPHWSLL